MRMCYRVSASSRKADLIGISKRSQAKKGAAIPPSFLEAQPDEARGVLAQTHHLWPAVLPSRGYATSGSNGSIGPFQPIIIAYPAVQIGLADPPLIEAEFDKAGCVFAQPD
ncbi:MAG: hypothetical protein AAFR68_22120, partial [Pseudomonadota bacterium]